MAVFLPPTCLGMNCFASPQNFRESSKNTVITGLVKRAILLWDVQYFDATSQKTLKWPRSLTLPLQQASAGQSMSFFPSWPGLDWALVPLAVEGVEEKMCWSFWRVPVLPPFQSSFLHLHLHPINPIFIFQQPTALLCFMISDCLLFWKHVRTSCALDVVLCVWFQVHWWILFWRFDSFQFRFVFMALCCESQGWLVVVCERSERLGGLGGSLDERAKFGSLRCLGWVLGTFCRVTYQVANGWRWGIDSPPGPWLLGPPGLWLLGVTG